MEQAAMDFSREPFQVDPPEIRRVKENPDLFAPDFEFWLVDNRHIWREFQRQANAMVDRGFRHYSARTIIEWMRHHTALHEVGGQWKINDHYTPDMARLYSLMWPGSAHLFAFRVQANSSKRLR